MATISFGGAPGVYINEVAGQSATPAIAAFSTVYMLVEVEPEIPTTLFPFNEPVQVTNTREYVRLIGGAIPSGKIELLSYQCVDAFFTQSYVGDLRVIRVGTPANVMEVQLNPSGFKTNGLGVSTPLEAGDIVHAQLLINGARLGEFTASGTWKGVPVGIPVDYVEGNFDNNKKIAIAIRDAIARAVTTDPNVSAGTIVRDLGVCSEQFAECAFEYLAGREFNAPISVVPESEPPSDGSYYVFTLNAYTVGPVIPDSENTNELVADYLQCLRTAFVDQEDQGYLTAPCAFAKFGPEGRRLVGQEMAFQAELNSHKWMAIADAGPYNVTDILEYNGFTQHAAAAPLKTGQDFLVGNSVYEWTADNTDYVQLRYTPLSGTESNPETAVNGSQNLNVPFNNFLSLRDNGIISFSTSTTPAYDRPGLLDLQGENWPSTKEAGTPVTLSDCVGALSSLEGETVYVVPTYLTPSNKTLTGYVYFAETYPQAVTAYNWVISQGGLDGDGTPQYPGVNTLPPGCIPVDTSSGSGELGDAVTGVTITNPGSGYNAGFLPSVAFPAPAAAGGVTATGNAVLGDTGLVDEASVTVAGSGYTNTPTVNVVNAGGDPGAGASVTCTLATVGGKVAKLALTSGGADYESTPSVGITAPAAAGGVAATATATLAATGTVKTLTLATPGQNFIATPSVSFTGGSSASASATLSTTGGRIVAINAFSGGSLYTAVPSVTLPGTTGVGATFSAILAASGGVATVAVSNGGSGYTLPPIVSFAGDGASAAATAVLATEGGAAVVASAGEVASAPSLSGTITLAGAGAETDIVIDYVIDAGSVASFSVGSAGSGWTQANVNLALAGSYGTVTDSDPTNWTTAPTLTVTLGYAVVSVTVGTNGLGYTTASAGFANAPGDTTGAGAVAGAVAIGKAVASISVTNAGSGYTAADPVALTITPAGGDTTGAGATATVYKGFPLASVTLNTGGSGYDESALVSVINDPSDSFGSGAGLTYAIGRAVASVSLTSGGSGYAATDVVSVSFTSGNPSAPATAVATKGFPVSGVTIADRGAGYLTAPSLTFTASPLDSGNTIVPASGATVLGFGIVDVEITNAGSGYTEADMPLTLVFTGGSPLVSAAGFATLQTKGTGVLTYEVPAWDLYVEIDGQTSDLILNDSNNVLDLNTLHLPGTLQNSTEDYQLAQFTRTFAETDLTKENPSVANSPVVFGCLNHGLVNGSVIYFTAPITKATGGTLVTASTSQASVKYYVSVINGNQFRLATTLTNLNSRIFIQFPTGGFTAGQTTLSYSGLLVAPENTSLYNNEGVVNIIRGRKYGFNTFNVLPTFYPANLDPLTGPAGQGLVHTLGFYRVENQPDEKYYSPYGEFDAGIPNPDNAGFLGDLILGDQDTQSFFCTPLVANDRSDQAYITPTYTDGGGVKRVLWGASLSLRYNAYKEAPGNLWRFNAVTSEELVDYGLRGTFNEGVPACVLVATGIDDAQKLLDDSQQYYNPRGFIAYYGPYLKNGSGAWIPASPYVTGVAIRRYRSEGFQYPPAGVKFPLNGVSAVQIPINSTQQDILNPRGCNVCRTLPGYGSTVFIWGGRTRINQQDAEQRQFQFVNTRVIMNVVYGSLRRAFDSQIFNVIDGFGLVYNKIISIGNSILNELYVRGALFGYRPSQAFQVICDERIQTSASLEAGIVHAKVFVVPVPTLERIEVDLIRVAIGNMQNELDAIGVGQDNAI
jgi:hypothetical protein